MSRKKGDVGRWTDDALEGVFARIVLRLLAAHNTPAHKATWQLQAVRPKVSVRQACEDLAADGYFTARIERDGKGRRAVHQWSTHPDKRHDVNDQVQKWSAKGFTVIRHAKATVQAGKPAEQFRDAYKEVIRRLRERPRAGETKAESLTRKLFRYRCLVSLEVAIEAKGGDASSIANADQILEWAIAGNPAAPGKRHR